MNLWRVTLDRDGAETSRELHPNVDGTTVGNLFAYTVHHVAHRGIATNRVRSVTFDIGPDGAIRWERADD